MHADSCRLFQRYTVAYKINPRPLIMLSLSESDESPETQSKLILGDDLSKGIASIGNELGYLTAAKKRAEEYAKRRAQDEQQALKSKEKEASKDDKAAAVNNYGPGDLSSWRGFANDGFEASAGNDGEDGWNVQGGILLVNGRQNDRTSNTDTQSGDKKLFLFEDNSSNEGKLIL